MVAHKPASAVLRPPSEPSARVFGPAYLDRVLRVDAPLRPPGRPPIDGSVEVRGVPVAAGHSDRLVLVPPDGRTLTIDAPPGWTGPTGRVLITAPPGTQDESLSDRHVRGCAWHDDLGGMGAGFAAALGGRLTSALGSENDPTARAIVGLLESYRIDHTPWRVPENTSDWTLLVTSGAHGDKLAVGFRGCHAALSIADMAEIALEPELDLVVVAGLPIAHCLALLDRAGPRSLRLLAPSIRTLRDRDVPISALAGRLDLLSCNRAEWDALDSQAQATLRAAVPLIAVTQGPEGARLRLGERELVVPAFPRACPPRDTNRAGEAFASTLLLRLWNTGWRRGQPLDLDRVRSAAIAATAAAALVLDRDRFGFPTPHAVDAALRDGIVVPAEPRDSADRP